MVDFTKLEKMTKVTNGGDIFIDGKILYKSFLDNPCFIEEKERNVLILKEKRFFPPYIVDIFYEDGEFVAYSQEYIEGAQSFKEAINSNRFSSDVKLKAIYDVFQKLKILHKSGFLIGDVHSENFIFNGNGGYIIDLDELRIPGKDDYAFMEYYSIKFSDKEPHLIKPSVRLDIMKATISALSLLYGFDFEEIAKDYDIERVKSYLGCFIEDKDFKNKVFHIFDKNSSEIIYFDDILRESLELRKVKEKK